MWEFVQYILGKLWGGPSIPSWEQPSWEEVAAEPKTVHPKPQVVTTSVKAESPYRNGFKKPAVNKRFVPFDNPSSYRCHCGSNEFWAWQSVGVNQKITCSSCGCMYNSYNYVPGAILPLEKVELDPRFY